MSLDFNDAGSQKNFDVIPDGTIATVRMTIRPGGAGDGEWLKRSKKGDSEAVDAEFVVLDAENPAATGGLQLVDLPVVVLALARYSRIPDLGHA